VSVTGRLANLGSTYLGPLARLQGRLHVRLYRRFGGRRWTRWLGRPVFCLTVAGRVSGEPRPVMLMLVRRGDDLVVCGSNGGNPNTPNWYRNLMAAGEASVTVGPDSWLVTAREVDGEEREACWRLLCEGYPDFATYQAVATRRLPVAVLERAVSVAGRGPS
jgi:deazaflavin-dependent oxidoreductase (nitroreductase family)